MFLAKTHCLILGCLLIVNSEIISAILTGSSNLESNATEKSQPGDTGKGANERNQNTWSETTSDVATNTTFYYDPNAFLVNKKEASKVNSEDKPNQVSMSRDEEFREQVKPASVSQTSGRSGRMLDLDALMGDFAASQANKARAAAQTGNRQSRYLPSSSLDVGGKRLHIQGFIPIVGVKDVANNEATGSGEDGNGELASDIPQRQRAPQQPTMNDLPYEHSSIGHASFGVQRYLNAGEMQTLPANQQQVDAKFSGATMMDTLKRPIKKLTGYPSGGNSQQQYSDNMQPPNCLCVPFYMCKNGFISESSLGKSQIQQMIASQQQQQQQQQHSLNGLNDQQLVMKAGQTINNGQESQLELAQSMREANAYGDSYPKIDERSLNRDGLEMSNSASDAGRQQESTNQTEMFDSNFNAQSANGNIQTNQLQLQNNANDEATPNSTDYSQDILGRMLGLKSNPPKSGSLTSSSGVCGLLRSCCSVPIHLIPSQQDMANERLMAQQYGAPSASMNRYQAQVQASNKHVTVYSPPSQSDQQMLSLQQQQQLPSMLNNNQLMNRFQQKSIPYGLPSIPQLTRSQPPINLYNNPMPDTTSLAHRSNQFQMANRYQMAPNQVAQYNRAASPMQQMQTFQQASSQMIGSQQAKAMPVPLASMNLGQQSQMSNQQSLASLALRNQPAGLGSRKILDGRCGLRQSAGITGRVQNLQYHESSADFGEYPGQVAILKRLSGSESLFVCGGTLISQYWVATAAHCIKKHAQTDLKIRLGEWDVHRDDEFYPFVEKEVRDLVVHPEFVAGNLVNDIALLRLDSPVDTSLPHVNPACLPGVDESFARQRCWVTGWGKDSFGQKGSFQAVLREVELPVIGQAECELALRSTRLGAHYRLHPGFICAGGEGGRDACEGDGGSGLYCVQEGIVTVAGLVSWGIGCGQAGVPGVYVSMAHYRPWIENIISIDEDIYSPYMNLVANNLISGRNNANNSNVEATQPPPTTTTTPN